MEQVNLGSLPDGTGGDSIRVGFQKCNDNFAEVAEQLKTAGGGASSEELKQIKDAATALTARVAQLEKAGSGGGVPAGELEELKQQLQQLQTKLAAAEQAASGAASKATTAQQTAATAQQTATSAQQAAGAAQQAASGATQTANAAKQEAAAAKQAADGKAPASHTHTAAQISDWDTALAQSVSQAVAGAFAAQKEENGYLKLPNGLIIQWVRINKSLGAMAGTYNFPIAFPNKCFGVAGGNQFTGGAHGSTIAVGVVSNATFNVVESGFSASGRGNAAQLFVIAIGY